MKINILYFAQLRELAGQNQEEINTSAKTALELYAQLVEIYAFPLTPKTLRVAINDEFASMSQPLNEGDEVAFIPPVSGG